MLLSAGYQACVDVFCNQGPLALQAMHPSFVLFGETLAAARSAPLIASLIGLVAVYLIGRQLWGVPVALLATGLLAISPTYLKFSRLALPEMVALAPALLAVAASARYGSQGRFPWLLLASVLLAVSLLIKPIAAPAFVPIAALAIGSFRVERRHLGMAALAGAIVLIGGCLLVGLDSIREQVVFRWQSRLAEGRGPDWNWWKITDELSHDQLGIFGLALAGAIVGAPRRDRAVLMVVGWLAASLLLLLFHTPLHDKHIVIMLPPVALLAGVALQALPGAVRAGIRNASRRLTMSAVASTAGALLYLATLPGLVDRNLVLVEGSEMIEPDPAQQWYAAASAALQASTSSGSFVVTDFPYVAYGADRLVPPQLVEASLTRIRAGSLTDEIAIAEASAFQPEAVFLWWDRLVRLPRFKRWVDERYQVVRVFAADREAVTTLMLPAGQSVDDLRETLSVDAPIGSDVRFGSLRLVSWGIERTNVAPGDRVSVTAVWEAEAALSRDLAAVLSVRAPGRVHWTSERLPLLGTGDGQRSWQVGRWIVWTGLVKVPGRLATGSYLVSLRVGEGKTGDFLPVTGSTRSGGLSTDDPRGVELADIEVR
jgi:hypothetical protein